VSRFSYTSSTPTRLQNQPLAVVPRKVLKDGARSGRQAVLCGRGAASTPIPPPARTGRPPRHGRKLDCKGPKTWLTPSAEYRCEVSAMGRCASRLGQCCIRRRRTTRRAGLDAHVPSLGHAGAGGGRPSVASYLRAAHQQVALLLTYPSSGVHHPRSEELLLGKR
jgi:hypothetical protein